MYRASTIFLSCLIPVLTACGDNSASVCTAGAVDCSCRDDGSCDTGLECKDNVCVVRQTCPEGSEGCPCYPNGTCDSKDGSTMTCEEGICVATTTSYLGGVGDPCDDVADCGKVGGTQLECLDGTCEIPAVTCPAGTFGCPCSDGTCDTGLVCVDNTCQAKPGTGMVIGNADVRACDVLIEKADGINAQFASSVKGVTARDGSRLAISFTSGADASLTGTVCALTMSDEHATDQDNVTFTKVECYDRHGAAVSNPEINLQ